MLAKSRRIIAVPIAACLLFLAPSTAAAAEEPPSPRFLAVIDAGSSGTRLVLFEDDPSDLRPLEVMRAKTGTPGLSSFAEDPAAAGPRAVAPLLRQLDEYLATRAITAEEVPVALLATAGMRNVRRDDPAATTAIFASTAESIAASGHPVSDNRILPAIQEATLAWLDTNVIAGTLDRADGGVGIIEIGGASAQVAFRSSTPNGRAVNDVKVAGRVIPVAAVSYLGLGGNDARAVMQRENDAGAFCFPNNAPGKDPRVYVEKAARPVDSATARFSWDRCTAAYADVVATVGAERTASATVAPRRLRDLPGFAGTFFVGLGSIQYTFATLGIEDEPNERAALRASVRKACSGADAWPRVEALYPPTSAALGETLCSTTSHQYEFVFGPNGVGAKPRLFTTIEVDLPKTPGWTSGYAITVLDP